jgi:hypothetical protein
VYCCILCGNYQVTRTAIAQSIQRCSTGWTIGVLGFDSRRGLGIFLFMRDRIVRAAECVTNEIKILASTWRGTEYRLHVCRDTNVADIEITEYVGTF